MIKVSLIGERKPISYIIILIVWNMGILFGISSVFISNKTVFVPFLIIFLVSFLIWIIGNLLVKSYIIVGDIEISLNLIKIYKDSKTLVIDISKTEELMLDYYGAKGDYYGYLGSMRINDGSKNVISFVYDGVNYSFRFLVTDRQFINSIYKFIKAWKKSGINIKILRYKKDVTNKYIRMHGRL